MTPRRLLAAAGVQLSACASPRLDAEVLLCHALDRPRSWLIAHADDALDAASIQAFNSLLKRRMQREPVAYITGEKEFWSHEFQVAPGVLIPRPETEHLIEAVLEYFPDTQAAYSFCDIGTGSGCIAVTLACEYPHAGIIASDISSAALNIARRNAARYRTEPQLSFREGDLFAALRPSDDPFDAIISNPPYVSAVEMGSLEPELGFEPRCALTDEKDGLHYLQGLLDGAAEHLKPGGLLMLETGLCGLPVAPPSLRLERKVHDLVGHLRCGIYRKP